MFHLVKNAKITTKLTAITAVSIALFAVLAGWAIYSLRLNKAGLDYVADALHRTAVATEAQIGTKEIGVTARNVFIADTKEIAVSSANKTLHYLKFVEERLLALRNMQPIPKLVKAIDYIRILWDKYAILTKESMDAALKAVDQQTAFAKLGTPLYSLIHELVEILESDGSNTNADNVKAINQTNVALNLRRVAIWRYIATQDQQQLAEFHKQIVVFDTVIAKLSSSNLQPAIRSRLDAIKQASDEHVRVGRELVRLLEISNNIYFHQATQIRSEAGDLLDNLVKEIIAEENMLISAMVATSTSTSQGMLVVGIVLAVLLFIITTLISRTITQPIVRLSALMEKLAEGHLDVTIDDTERGDEIGLMARSITRMIGSLGQLLRELRSLIVCTRAGELTAQKNKTQLKGEYADVVVEANELLDILTKPLIEVVEVVQHLANGNLRQRMQGTYEGELNILKSNVNRGLDDLLHLLKTCSAVGRVRTHVVKLCKK